MRRFRTFAALMLVGPLLATAGCSNIFAPAPYGPPQAALVPAVPAYLLGDVVGGYAARLKKARAAGLKPVAVADYVNQQELDLRRESAGTRVETACGLMSERPTLNVPLDGSRTNSRSPERMTSTPVPADSRRRSISCWLT